MRAIRPFIYLHFDIFDKIWLFSSGGGGGGEGGGLII
jgi:hypothetical protein